MRRRRDPFARVTYVPVRDDSRTCAECGAVDPRRIRQLTPGQYGPIHERPRARIYAIRCEPDSVNPRDYMLAGQFCSWSCAESHHGGRIGR